MIMATSERIAAAGSIEEDVADLAELIATEAHAWPGRRRALLLTNFRRGVPGLRSCARAVNRVIPTVTHQNAKAPPIVENCQILVMSTCSDSCSVRRHDDRS
jgi:hypothetical protein